MKQKSNKTLRCAVYTRKSTEHGLELEFNSLHAQREACEAYIKSQAAEGWTCLKQHYDDPAYSGGNMARPALQKLLTDIDAGLVDVIVVYKIDRLTRALADFAKLVELFDAKSVSFVAVTQQFNTTTSMGRLTLNVLLSFAQFERELSSERVRDKVAASRKKGKWMGGSVPLGYDSIGKRLEINAVEAGVVRLIFNRYLALMSFRALICELDQKGIVTKKREVQGKIAGGIPFTYGPLAYLLKNRVYLGEAGHKGSWFAGEHQPILDRTIFDQVQDLLKSNSVTRDKKRHDNGALLAGLLFDDRGNRMSPSYSSKKGIRYPFYVSCAILKGRKEKAGAIGRVSAADIERVVIREIRQRVKVANEEAVADRTLIERTVARVVISPSILSLTLKSGEDEHEPETVEIAWSTPRQRSYARIDDEASGQAPPQACNQSLVQAVVRAHAWIKLLSDRTYDSIESLSTAVSVHPKIVRNGLRFAFLAPSITAAILKGTQPENLELVAFKKDIPLSWARQANQFTLT